MKDRVTSRVDVIGLENSRSFCTPHISLLGRQILKSFRFVFVTSDNPLCYFRDHQTIIINLPSRPEKPSSYQALIPKNQPIVIDGKPEVPFRFGDCYRIE